MEKSCILSLPVHIFQIPCGKPAESEPASTGILNARWRFLENRGQMTQPAKRH